MLDKEKKNDNDLELDAELDGVDEIEAADTDEADDFEPRTLVTADSGSTPLDLSRLGLSEIAYTRGVPSAVSTFASLMNTTARHLQVGLRALL